MTKEELINLLQFSKAETVKYFNLADEDLAKSYGIGKWNIREILHHLADTEVLLHERLKRIIAEPKQVIYAFNQEQWNAAFTYKTEPLTHKKQVFEMFREFNIELVEKFYERFSNKEFVHSETGLRTLKDEFEKVATHNQTHLEQIKTALSK